MPVPPAIDELFAQALGSDEGSRWTAISALHRSADPAVLPRAAGLLDDPDPAARTAGADVLAQHGLGRATCLGLLLGRLVVEDDPEVLAALATGLGHHDDPRIAPAVLALVGHRDADVRLGATLALATAPDPRALEALLALMADPDPDVRDWATFAVGSQRDEDTPAVREALWARLEDGHEDTRGEALVGLARRGEAVTSVLLGALAGPTWSPLALEAAAIVGDPGLLPVLEAHPEAPEGYLQSLLDDALAACR
ncbi:MAG: HEAT repeat domain-containing protein [Alphaproteobacteria bacterium]|nr:HEAT repeat domain-containing protein [Alphaproteobacteria bacterium]MCB9692554.1 HEAT repeat domain-containing protein [Alphaproteobacteria bacterium]